MGFEEGVNGNKKVHLVGESMGGHIVGYYASLFPRDLASVTMTGPHGIALDESAIHMFAESHYLCPSTMEELRYAMPFWTHKKIPFPEILMRGLLETRLEKDEFYKSRKCNFHIGK